VGLRCRCSGPRKKKEKTTNEWFVHSPLVGAAGRGKRGETVALLAPKPEEKKRLLERKRKKKKGRRKREDSSSFSTRL